GRAAAQPATTRYAIPLLLWLRYEPGVVREHGWILQRVWAVLESVTRGIVGPVDRVQRIRQAVDSYQPVVLIKYKARDANTQGRIRCRGIEALSAFLWLIAVCSQRPTYLRLADTTGSKTGEYTHLLLKSWHQ